MPIKNKEGEVIAVVQVINKIRSISPLNHSKSNAFDDADIKVS